MESEVQAFYKNKTVFITGGSGFLGKVFLEKLLRATDVGRIYMLLRPKKGKDIRERIQAYASLPLFELLLKHKPTALERIVPIAGDCGEPELGLSATDRQRLVNEVHIVVHTAATVRFDEPLHNALSLNVRSVRIMLELAKKMQNLESFVHVSTAYSNCVVSHIDEKCYPENISCTGQEALNLLEKCSLKLLEKMTAGLQGEYPNTYTFTKALAEDLCKNEAADLPLCIYRPSIILASYKEPVSGWVDNFYGSSSIVYGVSMGVLRVAPCKSTAEASLVPVDYCANMMLVCAWKTARDAQLAKISKQPAFNSTAKPIYNHVSSTENYLTWSDFRGKMTDRLENYALTKMMWYPFIMFINYNILYKLMIFLLHTLPAHAVDLLLRLIGKKPFLVRIYDKAHEGLRLLTPFVNKTWTFNTRNTDELWQLLSAQDRELFPFDMACIDWNDYFNLALLGMRFFLAKEEPTEQSLQKGGKLYRRMHYLHNTCLVLLGSSVALILWYIFKTI